MGYKIEISFGFSKKTNEYKQHIISESIKKGCEVYFFDFDNHNHVLTFIFKENKEHIRNFIKLVNTYKMFNIKSIEKVD
jgi:hypothetical protein